MRPSGTKRLDQVDRRIARMERDVTISVETLVIFVRFRLATTPALPEPAAQAARAKAGSGMIALSLRWGVGWPRGPNLVRKSARTEALNEDGAIGSPDRSSIRPEGSSLIRRSRSLIG